MNELITGLTQKAGISTEQATKAVETFKDFIKDKFPAISGSFESLLAGGATATATTIGAAAATASSGGILDKISDVIPGQTGQKVEDFVKGAAHKVGDAYDNLKDKASDMFGGKKD